MGHEEEGKGKVTEKSRQSKETADVAFTFYGVSFCIASISSATIMLMELGERWYSSATL